MEKLRGESSIVEFRTKGNPPDAYLVRFHGRGLWLPRGAEYVKILGLHEVRIVLGASYPRTMPDLHWVSPIFHANISASGVVCLGGYGTHWVPSLGLDELCEMLWDMVRYQNFDVESPYNREAAAWAKHQQTYAFPLDHRSIRDLISRAPRTASVHSSKPPVASNRIGAFQPQEKSCEAPREEDEEIVDAELAEPAEQDIWFLD